MRSARLAFFRYDRPFGRGTVNLGDAMQTLALYRLFGRPDRFVDRESMPEARSEDPCLLFANGNISEEVQVGAWPGPGIRPLFFGCRFSPHLLTAVIAEKVRTHGPVGARDTATHEHLQALGIESRLVGCMTLTLASPPVPRRRTFVVDVPPGTLDAMPEPLFSDAYALSHVHPPGAPIDVYPLDPATRAPGAALGAERCAALFGDGTRWGASTSLADLSAGDLPAWAADLAPEGGVTGEEDRRAVQELIQADALLRLYASAALVVTGRLHVALPCLALGTPVVLVTGKKVYAPSRFDPFEWFARRWDETELGQVDWSPTPPDLRDFSERLREQARGALAEACERL